MMHAESSWNGRSRPSIPVTARLAAGRALCPWLALAAGLVAGVWTTAWYAAPARADESLQQRAERLQQMSDADKTDLLQKQRRFDGLPPAEQTRLREIHDQLSRDPDQAHLRQVLTRYSDWLHMMTALERAEIDSLSPDKRIERIKELIRVQNAKRIGAMAGGRQMSARDLTVIHDWFDEFLDKHAKEIVDTFPDPPFGYLKKDDDRERDRVELGRLYVQSMSPNLPHPSQEEEQQLQARISKEALEVLNQADSAQARSRIIRWWIGAAVLSRMRFNPSQEELHKFAQESLSDEERTRLESLPVEQMNQKLRGLLFQHRFAGDRSRRFPWGPRSGDHKPGPEGGPGFGGPPPGGPPPGGSGGPGPWVPPGEGPAEPGGRREPPPDDKMPPPDPAKPPSDPGE